MSSSGSLFETNRIGSEEDLFIILDSKSTDGNAETINEQVISSPSLPTQTTPTSILKKRAIKDLPKPIILQPPTFTKKLNKTEPNSTSFALDNDFFSRADLDKFLQTLSNDELNDRKIQKKFFELKSLINERRKHLSKPIDYHFSLPQRHRQKPVDLHLPYDYTYQEILNKPYPIFKRR